MFLHQDLVDSMVRDHIEQLTAYSEQGREIRQAGVVRRAVGAMLIHLGERVSGQQVQPVPPPLTSKLATP